MLDGKLPLPLTRLAECASAVGFTVFGFCRLGTKAMWRVQILRGETSHQLDTVCKYIRIDMQIGLRYYSGAGILCQGAGTALGYLAV